MAESQQARCFKCFQGRADDLNTLRDAELCGAVDWAVQEDRGDDLLGGLVSPAAGSLALAPEKKGITALRYLRTGKCRRVTVMTLARHSLNPCRQWLRQASTAAEEPKGREQVREAEAGRFSCLYTTEDCRRAPMMQATFINKNTLIIIIYHLQSNITMYSVAAVLKLFNTNKYLFCQDEFLCSIFQFKHDNK